MGANWHCVAIYLVDLAVSAAISDRLKISLAEMARAIPPYTELMEWLTGNFLSLLISVIFCN